MNIDLLLNPQWLVFINPDETSPVFMKLDHHTLDLCPDGKLPPAGGKALLVNEFESPEAGSVEFGCSADYFMSVKFNGEILLDTLSTGNKGNTYEISDYILRLPVKAGKNKLEVTLRPGSTGWKFICGDPGNARAENTLLLKTANTSTRTLYIKFTIISTAPPGTCR